MRRQAKLAEEYRAAGMTEEQIREMYAFDLADNMDALSNGLDHTLSTDRYWWIEMLTLYAIEGFTHEEIAKRFGLTCRAITKRIDKLRKLLGTFRK